MSFNSLIRDHQQLHACTRRSECFGSTLHAIAKNLELLLLSASIVSLSKQAHVLSTQVSKGKPHRQLLTNFRWKEIESPNLFFRPYQTWTGSQTLQLVQVNFAFYCPFERIPRDKMFEKICIGYRCRKHLCVNERDQNRLITTSDLIVTLLHLPSEFVRCARRSIRSFRNEPNRDSSSSSYSGRNPIRNVAPICCQRTNTHGHTSLMSERILPRGCHAQENENG